MSDEKKKEKDEQGKRASPPSSLPARGNSSTDHQESAVPIGGNSSSEVLCPICLNNFRSMQRLRGHLKAHSKEERSRFFRLNSKSPSSKDMKQRDMIAAMNLASMKAATDFWRPSKNKKSKTGSTSSRRAGAKEDLMVAATPLRVKKPPEMPPSSPPPSPPGEHPGFPFDLNRSPPPSPGAAGQAQPVV